MYVIAYIDAGMGAMLLQWIIAFVIGAGLFFRVTIVRGIRKLCGRNKTQPKDDSQESDEKSDGGRG